MPNFEGIELRPARSRTQSVNSEEINLLEDSNEDEADSGDEDDLLLSPPGTRSFNTQKSRHSKSQSALAK